MTMNMMYVDYVVIIIALVVAAIVGGMMTRSR